MSNKYIEKFFLLTEQSISSPKDEREKKNNIQGNSTRVSKYLHYIFIVFASLAIYTMAHKKTPLIETNRTILTEYNKPTVIATDDENLTSVIPSFRLAARQQYLSEVPIKRLDLALLNAAEMEYEYQQQVHVMDKVLVVPKLFG